jgi:hypothetical protein
MQLPRGTLTPMDRISLSSRDTRTRLFSRDTRLRLLLLVSATALAAGCTLITDVDRSKIPPPPVVTPDPVRDAGSTPEDGGTPPESTGDAGAASDAGTDAAASDAAPGDAGSTDLADAQADGG